MKLNVSSLLLVAVVALLFSQCQGQSAARFSLTDAICVEKVDNARLLNVPEINFAVSPTSRALLPTGRARVSSDQNCYLLCLGTTQQDGNSATCQAAASHLLPEGQIECVLYASDTNDPDALVQNPETAENEKWTLYQYSESCITPGVQTTFESFQQWVQWSACTRTCNGGVRLRRRTCNVNIVAAYPSYVQCLSVETSVCNVQPCPTFNTIQSGGVWSEWRSWTACSATCGPGIRLRVRTCTSGNCAGDSFQSGQCSVTATCTQPVRIWGQWNSWACSVTCGNGTALRVRACQNGNCTGDTFQSKPCNPGACAVILSAAWTLWTQWSFCPVTCGGGIQARVRICAGNAICSGNSSDSRICNSQVCLSTQWSSWGVWTSCSQSCGGGTRTRRRICNEQSVGQGCFGDATQTSSCTFRACPSWGAWQPWSSCSASCGSGTQGRTRSCFNGSGCQGSNQNSQPCNTKPCQQWSAWTDWGLCSATCGPATKKRKRSCDNGTDTRQCDGASEDEISCTAGPCPAWGPWTAWTRCSATCGQGKISRERQCKNGSRLTDSKKCPGLNKTMSDCYLSSCSSWANWESWTKCTVTCGEGRHSRKRLCIGANCVGSGVDISSCNTGLCPVWNQWSTWGSCSVSCGNGQKIKSRTCKNNIICIGQTTMSAACHTGACPAWGHWTQWNQCAVTCGGGTHERSRKCLQGLQDVNLDLCYGDINQIEFCNTIACPMWMRWHPWESCSSSCGSGTRMRVRDCFGPKCEGIARENEICSSGLCPIIAEWMEWSKCSATCGYGLQTRIKKCPDTNGFPMCIGKQRIVQSCDAGPCSRLSWWSTWTVCSASCGGGNKKRSRYCEKGNIKYENRCNGKLFQTVDCNEFTCPFWTQWSEWSTCQRGDKSKFRMRNCYGGSCYGDFVEKQNCTTFSISLKIWSQWSSCKRKNGSYVQHRFRNCTGDACSGQLVDSIPCTPFVSATPYWTTWSEWSNCSSQCSSEFGTKTRQRTCLKGNCDGDSLETNACTGKNVSCKLYSSVSLESFKVSEEGEWLRWSSWSECSVTCGPGSRHRSRQCKNTAKCIGSVIENSSCENALCPVASENDFLNQHQWTSWTACSSTCGEGLRFQFRECTENTCGSDDTRIESCNSGPCFQIDGI